MSDLVARLNKWAYIREQEAAIEDARRGIALKHPDEVEKALRTTDLKLAAQHLRDLLNDYYIDLSQDEFQALISKLYQAKDALGNYVLIPGYDAHIGCNCHTAPQIQIGPAIFRCPDAKLTVLLANL